MRIAIHRGLFGTSSALKRTLPQRQSLPPSRTRASQSVLAKSLASRRSRRHCRLHVENGEYDEELDLSTFDPDFFASFRAFFAAFFMTLDALVFLVI